MVATVKDFEQEPEAADDAASAAWFDVDTLDPSSTYHLYI
jgi:hypothetical protein